MAKLSVTTWAKVAMAQWVSGGAVSSWDWTWSCAMWRWRSSVNNRAGAEVISPATDRLGEAEGGARPRGLHGV